MLRITQFFLLLILVSHLFAQSQNNDIKKFLESITVNDLESYVNFLASDELEGREATYRGSEISAKYIATQFQLFGVKPAIGDTSYFQKMQLVKASADFSNTHLTVSSVDKKISKKYTTNVEIYFFPNSTKEIEVTGQIIFVGYGISAPEYKYDDYAGIDVTGKIVLAFNHEPQEKDSTSVFNGKQPTKYTMPRKKAEIAKEKGAIGILVMRDPNNNHPVIGETLKRYSQNLDEPVFELVGTPPSIPLFYITDELAQEIMGQKFDFSDYQKKIDKEFKSKPVEVKDKVATIKTAIKDKELRFTQNVIGYIEGSDSNLKSEYIIIGGHYDHLGRRGDKIYYGADDDASGISGLLEVAEAYGTNPLKPKRTIIFITFTAEEKGLLGSKYYVENPIFSLDKTVAMFQLDMIGRNNMDKDEESNSVTLFYSAQAPELKTISDESNKSLELKIDFDENVTFTGSSDHAPFHDKNVPVIFYFAGYHKDYHQPTDTADKLNYGKMEKITKLVFLSSWSIVNNVNRIKWDSSIKEVSKKDKKRPYSY
jgi:hypothetical protein